MTNWRTEKAGEVTGTLVITLIALSVDLASLDKEGIATLMEGIKTGNISAATLARACGDTRQMAKAAQTFFEREAAEQIADMSVSQARYLLKTGEQVQKAAGGTIRLGKTEILKLLDNFADDIAADIAAETLAAQIGKTRTMEAIESVLDKSTFEAVKDAIEGRALEPAELEKLNQVIRSYSLQKGEKMSTSQIRGLLKDGSFLTKSVDDVVAELVKNPLRSELTQSQIADIISIKKGRRPKPESYLSQEYIHAHLAQFNNGASIIMTKEQYIMYVKDYPTIGFPHDGTQFVMPKNFCDDIASKAAGDISYYEKALGFDAGHFSDGDGLVRIDIQNLDGLNLRVPSGNETGANNHWIPGGITEGGVPEAVTDLIPNIPDNVVISEIK